jgi:hypothetical protein
LPETNINDPNKTNFDVARQESSVLLPSYYELTKASDVVILGRLKSEVGIINTAREPGNNSAPDPRFYTIGVVYQVEVDEYLKGSGPETIFVARFEGKTQDGKTPSPLEIEQIRGETSKNEQYIPFRAETTYLMFLHAIDVWDDYKIDGLRPDNLFVRTAEPWLFDASNKNSVSVIDHSMEVLSLFPPQSIHEILAQMNDPKISPPVEPYPSPNDNRRDQSQPASSNYPDP